MEVIIKSDVGVVRAENQDKAAVFQKGSQTLAILCDGMGGHAGGSFASAITIETFKKEFNKEISESKISNWFEKIINKSKKEMAKFASDNLQLMDMGTTVTATLITRSHLYVFNIGDSRTYIYNDLLHQITKDHNLRNHYINKYNYSPEEAARVIGASALTSALGPEKRSIVDFFVIPKTENIQYVVLTSDGIHDYIAKPIFEKLLSSKENINKKSENIIKQSIKGKSSDNLTIIIIGMGV